MIEEMAGRPLYLQKHVTRHGKVAWYVRVKRGKLVRLKAEYGSEAFWDEYRSAIAGEAPTRAKPGSNSLQWLYDRYRESQKWSALSKATKKQRENIFLHVMAKAGAEPFVAIDSADIAGGIDARKGTPAQARNYLDAMKGLFRWAKANNHCPDPTSGVERPRRLRGGSGFPVWDEADVQRFRTKWPVGTRQRLWFELLLSTGLRRGDAVKAGRQHIQDGMIVLVTEKTGMTVYCSITDSFAEAFAPIQGGDLAFIRGENGKPLTKESFGNLFREACNQAGVKKAAHGLRKLAATRDAEAGYSERELEAKYGWTGGFMASLYTRSANRKKLARDAAARVLPKNARVLPEKTSSESNALDAQIESLVRSRKVALP